MRMIIFVGNIGTGKSLIASKLARQGKVVVSMDTIQAMIAGGEYGRYDYTKKELYHDIETVAIETSLKNEMDIVIDRTNMDKKRRNRFIELGRKHNAEIICYHFEVGDKEKCIVNRMKNHRGISEKTWRSVWDKMSEVYEKPTQEEGFSSIIEMPHKYKSFAFDFDGIIVTHDFPRIGKPIKQTIDLMQQLSKKLYNIIIVSTCRSGEYEREMNEFLNKENIPFDTINYNPIFKTGSRKLFAHEYYDDRNMCITKRST